MHPPTEPPPLDALEILLPALLLAFVVLSFALWTDCRYDERQFCRDNGGKVYETPADDIATFRCLDPGEAP